MKRYIHLESVGSFIDSYTLDILPELSNGKISFNDRMGIESVENPDFWDNMSRKDIQEIVKIINKYNAKIKFALEEITARTNENTL